MILRWVCWCCWLHTVSKDCCGFLRHWPTVLLWGCVHVCWVGAGAQLGSWLSLWTPTSSLFASHCKTSACLPSSGSLCWLKHISLFSIVSSDCNLPYVYVMFTECEPFSLCAIFMIISHGIASVQQQVGNRNWQGFWELPADSCILVCSDKQELVFTFRFCTWIHTHASKTCGLWYLTGTLRKIMALPSAISSCGSVSFWLINISQYIRLSSSTKEMTWNEKRQIKVELCGICKAITVLASSHLGFTNIPKQSRKLSSGPLLPPVALSAAPLHELCLL